jgi:mannose-6-phosphate isomerase-like protein (cupin superfamily)
MSAGPAAAALLLGLFLTTDMARAKAADGAEYVTAAQLKSYVAGTKDGLAVHDVTVDPASRAIVVRRDKSGEAELHVNANDVMVAQEGTITMILGGRIEGGKETAKGEFRGGKIIGGRTHVLHPGDMLWIPAGVPHHMVLKPGGSFRYVVIKSDSAKPADAGR